MSQEKLSLGFWRLRLAHLFHRASNGCNRRSPGELLMTRSTSEVAVCCSSASESSRVRACTSSNNRTFSIAIAAWSANVATRSNCLSVKGSTRSPRDIEITRDRIVIVSNYTQTLDLVGQVGGWGANSHGRLFGTVVVQC